MPYLILPALSMVVTEEVAVVTGMPIGSLGIEVPGRPAERYQTFTFDRSGKTGVFASR